MADKVPGHMVFSGVQGRRLASSIGHMHPYPELRLLKSGYNICRAMPGMIAAWLSAGTVHAGRADAFLHLFHEKRRSGTMIVAILG